MKNKFFKKLLLIGLILKVAGNDTFGEYLDGDEDTVVVEAAVNSRKTRQIFSWNQSNNKNTWGHFGEGSLCLTSSNALGSCMSMKNCYPYFKLPDVGTWERWMIGNYDTCSYYNSNGFQTFGICCTNTVAPDVNIEVDHAVDNNIGSIKDNNFPSWPPPIPTHPPDHTAATHPPGFGVQPVQTTTTTKRTTTKISTRPTKTTTKRPAYPSYPNWPPPIPTHPPSSGGAPPTTTQSPVDNAPISSGSCGVKSARSVLDETRIVGGEPAVQGEWPWIAVLFNGGKQFCGGSLIDNTHILTAAHCIAHMSSWDVARLTVRLGDHNIYTSSETQHIERRVKRLVRHRGFDMRTLYNDIAILTLDQPVKYSGTVSPICLPGGLRNYSGQRGIVVGWGSVRENGPQPATLQKVELKIWSNSQCAQKYGSAAPGGITEGMICAGEANKDSCSGDSGGPMVVNDGRWTQVGIVSWGIGCGKGQYPGVYTRVTSFLPWIQKNTKDH